MKQNRYGLMGIYEYLGIPLKMVFLSIIKLVSVLFGLMAWVFIGQKASFDSAVSRSVSIMTSYASERIGELEHPNKANLTTFQDERFINGIFASITIAAFIYIAFIQIMNLVSFIVFIMVCGIPHVLFSNWRAQLELAEFQRQHTEKNC
jgi:hypothetical protein